MKNKLMAVMILGSLSLTSCVSPQDTESNNGNSDHGKSERILCPGAQSENTDGYGGGNGTQENPYLICTADQFKAIQGDMGLKRFFRLTSDIDFSSDANLRIIAVAPFASIDGANHKLTNITIKHGYGYKDNGLFGQLVKDLNGNRDEIKNLIIENVKIIGDGTEDGGGVIASANWGGIISNVHVSGVVQIEYPDAGQTSWNVGGLVGRNSWLIEDSSFDGEVSGVYNVGGIAGLNEGTIRNSKSSGMVRGNKGVGGIIGVHLKSGVMESSSSGANVIANQYFGALAGLLCDFNDYSRCGIIK